MKPIRERTTHAAVRCALLALAGFTFMGSLAGLGAYLSVARDAPRVAVVERVSEPATPAPPPGVHAFAR